MAKELPDEVYINKTETLPRALVSQCAKSGCKRCGGAGWFRFAGGFGQLFLCPCAQEKVRAKVTETKDAVNERLQRPVLELVTEVVGRMVAAGEAPTAMVCSPDIGARIREAAGDAVIPDKGAAFRIIVTPPRPLGHKKPSKPAQVCSVDLLVYPDPLAPPKFSTFLDDHGWAQLQRRFEERAAQLRAEAQREQDAAAELAQMRAELRSGRL
jgi:hypothetical protein